jgi:hypothetical protein
MKVAIVLAALLLSSHANAESVKIGQSKVADVYVDTKYIRVTQNGIARVLPVTYHLRQPTNIGNSKIDTEVDLISIRCADKTYMIINKSLGAMFMGSFHGVARDEIAYPVPKKAKRGSLESYTVEYACSIKGQPSAPIVQKKESSVGQESAAQIASPANPKNEDDLINQLKQIKSDYAEKESHDPDSAVAKEINEKLLIERNHKIVDLAHSYGYEWDKSSGKFYKIEH